MIATSKAASAQLTLSKRAYGCLLTDLRRLLEEGRARSEAALSRELIRTYHAIGQRIAAERLTERAGYGGAILGELADELGMHVRVLQQALAFARLYREAPTEHAHLRWTHYRELLRATSDDARSWYAEQAETQTWTARQLAEAIRRGAHTRALVGVDVPDSQQAPGLPRPQAATYVYKATVERVVDGDTLLLVVDLGFHVLKRQRVRLARLDTPALQQEGGREAQSFVRDVLASVDFVVVKTNKIDLYGRYVGHIFYAPGVEDAQQVFAKGRYLNAELVKGGFARVL
ncbi:MAG: thermonuclease family protein [Deltaproteobacteria bacterium]|nr:thermonuclease family protein [Deltaproteobacteria bacterium]